MDLMKRFHYGLSEVKGGDIIMNELSIETALQILERFESVSLTDKSGRIIWANKNWLHFFRVSADDVKNKYVWDVVPETRVRCVLKNKEPLINECFLINNNQVVVSYYPLFKEKQFNGVAIFVLIEGKEDAEKLTHKIQLLNKKLTETEKKLEILSKAHYSMNQIVGESDAIYRLKEEITAAARTRSTVLIEGETGVGKELVAHSIHDLSSRSDERFVRVNCSAIPSELMESEFFGYEEGSFTGASKSGKIGKFELSSKGSLFLDEIHQLPYQMQPKFLRVLQEREIERIGSKDVIHIDTRFIAATNISLEKLIEKNEFRSDLFYRLNVINIRIPPLRERKEDIPILVKRFITELNMQLDMNISHVDKKVMDVFLEYQWPGNIRELQNVIEGAMNRAYDDTLELKHIESFINRIKEKNRETVFKETVNFKRTIKKEQADIELLEIQKILNETGGNRTKTAEILGISRTAFYKKLKKFNLID